MTRNAHPATRFARNPEVLWRSTSVGPVLLAPGDDAAIQLTGPVAAVWELLDEPKTVAELEEALLDLLGTGIGAVAPIGELLQRGLVGRA